MGGHLSRGDGASPGQRHSVRLRGRAWHPHDRRPAPDRRATRLTAGARVDRRGAPQGMSTVGIVVGNPKPRSRTLEVAEAVAHAVAGPVGLADAERIIVDLAVYGPLLFDPASTRVRDAVEGIAACPLAVVASPTYKASYTGLLKSFLDWFSTTGL